ncbi:heparan-sulfate 6-O-sulfotransferase 3-like [Limulus polyphemus]|uniref:Heparan-sulfate 6-O-sulfotransferase n=1 Tax=Limulus polyphemus TaxID=6850 RepID=A0ABM1BZW2_LIMPO|nr:heparan-sulfate 6-O-sulfotransferase 3-like [Limulus polyphemus]
MNWMKKKWLFIFKFVLTFSVVTTIGGIIFLVFLCQEQKNMSSLSNYKEQRDFLETIEKYRLLIEENIRDSDSLLALQKPKHFFSNFSSVPVTSTIENFTYKTARFDIRKSDVIVFLHIQKTCGSTFGWHLVRDLDLEKPCQCREEYKICKCYRPNSYTRFWLLSRNSLGWKCGIHADWTEMTNCVDLAMNRAEGKVRKRRYFYVTVLRDPVTRFISEYKHVLRGATWKDSRHWCGGRTATEEELPSCFSGENWLNVTLEEFMKCPSNMAINRQTRMLADLSLIGCYNKSAMSEKERDLIMLQSAKTNLESMSYFGLCEYQKFSQYLFERTFDLYFLISFEQYNTTRGENFTRETTEENLQKIRKLNYLDVELYNYAKNLFMSRFKKQMDIDREEE